MAIGIEINVNLDTLARKIRDAKDRSMYRGAAKVFRISQSLVPVDSGDLKDSGQIKKEGDAQYTVSYGDGLPDDRAFAQEYGAVHTSKDGSVWITPAQPYLTPAVMQANVVSEVSAAFFDELK